MSNTTTPKAILFLGATGGCGLSALRRSLEAGHICIALCRTPSKLSAKLPAELQNKLKLEQGNAHDVAAVARCLVNPSNPGRVVDMVFSSIGGAFSLKTGIDDAHVCEKGARALLEALALVRKNGATGSPRIIGVSSTGISDAGRDIPLLMIPLYKGLLAIPHKDKKMLEELLAGSGEQWTIVRPAWLTDGPAVRNVRAGMEDLTTHTFEKKEIGYTISREDVGKWMFENLVQERDATWVHKAASLAY